MGIHGSDGLNRVVFLDRDGVINRATVRGGKPYPPGSVAEIEILPGVTEALDMLRRAGLKLAVVSNQPDVARGTQQQAIVEAINAFLSRALRLDHFEICYHDDATACSCRKPKPGLIHAAARVLESDPKLGFMVGDRWKDIEAGRAAGCRTVWLDCGYGEPAPTNYDYRAESLLDATPWIIDHANVHSATERE